MTTYALPISERIAARVAELPADQVAALNTEIEELMEEFLDDGPINPADYPLTEKEIASIREGLADSGAGRAIDGDTFFAEAFARVGLPYPPEQKP